jgi:hypothetical protein
MVTSLQIGLHWVQILAATRDFPLLQIVQTRYGAHQTFYSVGSGNNFPAVGGAGLQSGCCMMLAKDLHEE